MIGVLPTAAARKGRASRYPNPKPEITPMPAPRNQNPETRNPKRFRVSKSETRNPIFFARGDCTDDWRAPYCTATQNISPKSTTPASQSLCAVGQ